MSITSLLSEIDKAVENFLVVLPDIEKEITAKVELVLRTLDVDGDGNIKPTAANLKKLNALKGAIEKAVLNKSYTTAVSEYLNSFATVAAIQTEYFQTLIKTFEPKGVIEAVRKMAVENAAAQLTEAGIEANVTNRIKEFLSQNITSKQNIITLNKNLKSFITADGEVGLLERYTKTVAITSINVFAAQYNDIFAEQTGLKWYRYVGALVKTSRPWCEKVVEKEFVHESEFAKIITGLSVPLNPKTGLPQGMFDGTNAENLTVNRGGWNCNHLLIPVLDMQVPKALRETFK